MSWIMIACYAVMVVCTGMLAYSSQKREEADKAITDFLTRKWEQERKNNGS